MDPTPPPSPSPQTSSPLAPPAEENTPAAPAIPMANTKRISRFSWMWIIPILALGASVWLLAKSFSESGFLITINFPEGHGLKVEDTIRYRGITIGEVEQIDLSPDLRDITVTARLKKSARAIAVEGSQFWIVRPQLALEGARGLETVVGAKYISVIPGPPEAPTRRLYAGLPDPPQQANHEPGALVIQTTSGNAAGLRPGAPVTYRQVQIGNVTRMGLSRNASRVEAELTIDPPYTALIRENTRFWKISGASFSAGILSGIEFDLDSMSTLLLGGISIANPPNVGRAAENGDVFPLAEEAAEEWLTWESTLDLESTGPATATLRTDQPQALPALMRWIEPGLIRDSERLREGYLTVVGNQIIGPNNLLVAPRKAEELILSMRLADTNLVLETTEFTTNRLTSITAPPELTRANARTPEIMIWPPALTRIAEATKPEDIRIIAEKDPMFISTDQLTAFEHGWKISDTTFIDPRLHGCPILAAKDEHLIGILFVDGDGASVALMRNESN